MEISKEQKEAIEYLKTRLYGNKGCKYIDVAQEDLRIFINLVDSLQKENEELKDLMAHKNAYTKKIEKDLFENCSNYVISKQKVKDKIEELNKYKKKEIYPSLYQWSDITITEHYDEMIELLQEIIGDK